MRKKPKEKPAAGLAARNLRQLLYALGTASVCGISTDLIWDIWLTSDYQSIARLSTDLRDRLAKTQKAEKDHRARRSSQSPVRDARQIPRSFVALLVWKMVERCTATRRISPPELVELLSCLLSTDAIGLQATKEAAAKLKASMLLADNPDMRTSTLAKKLGVSSAAISQWKADPAFQSSLGRLRQIGPIIDAYNLAAKQKDVAQMAVAVKKLRAKTHP